MQEASFFLDPIIRSKNHCAAFVERIPGVRTSTNKEETLTQLTNHHSAVAQSLGFNQIFYAEQIHGDKITVITKESPTISAGVDALITSENTLLGIHVADCGALYLLDQKTGAIGLLHSGKKGPSSTSLEVRFKQ